MSAAAVATSPAEPAKPHRAKILDDNTAGNITVNRYPFNMEPFFRNP